MIRRSFLLATGATLATAGSAWANALPYGSSLVFIAHRNGQKIGTHSLAFREEADRQNITTTIDFAVRMIGISVYRYQHRSQEVWSGGRFTAIAAETNGNGEKYAVQAQHDGANLVVRRREPQSFMKTSTGDEALEQQHWIREVHSGSLLPSTH